MVTNQFNMETKSLNVAIVEDNDPKMQSLYKRFVSLKEKYESVITFNALPQVLSYQNCLNAYVIIVNIKSTGIDWVNGITQIKNNWPNCFILVMSDSSEGDCVVKVITAGASGYIGTDTPAEKVEEAILEIIDGGAPVTPLVARKLVEYFQVCKSKIDELTKRELEVTKCLVNGMSYKLIAAELNVSIDTVRKHVTSVYSKLNINSKGELFALYRDVVNY
jgi:DNA-binding NarL/FixJ family response regulator